MTCLNTPNPWCFPDWYCYKENYSPTDIKPNLDTDAILVTKKTYIGEGDKFPNQPNAGSVASDCTPITEETIHDFKYYRRNDADYSYYKDENGEYEIIEEDPSKILNPCQIPAPSCIEYNQETYSYDYSKCSETTQYNYKVGDIFWPACRGGKNNVGTRGYTCLLGYTPSITKVD